MPTINQKWLCKSEKAKIFLKSRDNVQRGGREMAMEPAHCFAFGMRLKR